MLPPIFGVLFDGIAYGMLLFVLSVGLSVTLGLMNFVNLAHCAFAMLGGYVTAVLVNRYGWPFLATLPLAFLAAAAASVVLERVFYRRLYRASDLDQVLLTIGLAFISVAVATYFFTTNQQPIETPSFLRGSIDFLGIGFGRYRVFLIGVALTVTLLLVAGLEYTRFGAMVRASVDNQRMARGLGIDVDRTFAFTFALGSGLAGLGGGLAIEIVGLDPNFAFTYLVYVLIIVSVGGLGSIAGSFAAAILIGVSDVAGKYYAPELGAFLIYLVMVVVLMGRPAGLFGRR
ncbi:MAG TPA: branched-chain amino acid ABC transporter permease [Pseudolabrys sp.]|jgi:branched-chain amino acid transport system permease protein|nr:branched-chain amino acid ABC transporter permease [Pseudolabrys sp.]